MDFEVIDLTQLVEDIALDQQFQLDPLGHVRCAAELRVIGELSYLCLLGFELAAWRLGCSPEQIKAASQLNHTNEEALAS